MGRPAKDGVDYFPHRAKHGETMFILESQFGNDGYATWFKILEILATKSGHYLDCHNGKPTWEYLKAKTHLDNEKLKAIIDLLAKVGAIDSELWASVQVIWSQHFVDGIAEVYKKRHTEIPEKPTFCHRNSTSADVSVTEGTQSKVKESKVKESRERTTFLSNSEEVRLSEYLFSNILQNNPQAKKPNIQVWAKQIDLMLRIDNRAPADIQAVIDWCQDDEFWKVNILSTKKLREQFDRLWLKMTAKPKSKHNGIQEWLSKGDQNGRQEG